MHVGLLGLIPDGIGGHAESGGCAVDEWIRRLDAEPAGEGGAVVLRIGEGLGQVFRAKGGLLLRADEVDGEEGGGASGELDFAELQGSFSGLAGGCAKFGGRGEAGGVAEAEAGAGGGEADEGAVLDGEREAVGGGLETLAATVLRAEFEKFAQGHALAAHVAVSAAGIAVGTAEGPEEIDWRGRFDPDDQPFVRLRAGWQLGR